MKEIDGRIRAELEALLRDKTDVEMTTSWLKHELLESYKRGIEAGKTATSQTTFSQKVKKAVRGS